MLNEKKLREPKGKIVKNSILSVDVVHWAVLQCM